MPKVKTRSVRKVSRTMGALVNTARLLKAGTKVARNLRLKKTVSRTKTKTQKKKENEQLEISQHNDLSLYKLPAVTLNKKVHKTIGGCTYINQNQWLVEGTQGTQGVDFPEALMTRQQIIGDTNNGILERIRWADDPFLLILGPNADASTIYPGPFPAVNTNDKLYLRKVDTTLELLSMTNVAQHVIIYWLMPKTDTSKNPRQMWEEILASKYSTQGPAVIPANVGTLTATAGTSTILLHGQMPFDHPEFRKAWTYVNKEEIVLQPGDQRKYEMKIQYNTILNRQEFVSNRQGTYMKGVTVVPFIIAKAGLVGIEGSGDMNTTRVAHGFTKVGVLQTHKIKFGALPATRPNTARTYQGTIVNAATGEKQQIINDLDQEVPAIFT